jgi:hypothetical protein
MTSQLETKNLGLSQKDCVGQSSGFSQLYAMARLRVDLAKESNNINFWELLSDIAPSCHCTVPVDSVYAFLGLSKDDETTKALRPDYSLSLKEVMTWTTEAVIHSSNSLEIFGLVDRGSYNPSWVCDWTRPALTIPLWSFLRPTVFDVARKQSFSATSSIEPSNQLICRGASFDAVKVLQKPFTSSTHWAQRCPVKFLLDIDDARSELQLSYHYEDQEQLGEWEERYMRVALADGTLLFEQPNYAAATSSPLTAELLANLIQEYRSRVEHMTRGWSMAETMGNKDERGRGAMKNLLNLSRIASGRRICATNSGMLALGPAKTKKDDLICMLYGSKVPLVLRRGRHDDYTLVGQAYVEGFMAGEVFLKPNVEHRSFVLV